MKTINAATRRRLMMMTAAEDLAGLLTGSEIRGIARIGLIGHLCECFQANKAKPAAIRMIVFTRNARPAQNWLTTIQARLSDRCGLIPALAAIDARRFFRAAQKMVGQFSVEILVLPDRPTKKFIAEVNELTRGRLLEPCTADQFMIYEPEEGSFHGAPLPVTWQEMVPVEQEIPDMEIPDWLLMAGVEGRDFLMSDSIRQLIAEFLRDPLACMGDPLKAWIEAHITEQEPDESLRIFFEIAQALAGTEYSIVPLEHYRQLAEQGNAG